MALELKTTGTYSGPSMVSRPPLPDGAVGYADFLGTAHQVTPAASTLGPLTNSVVNRDNFVAGLYYGKTGLALGRQYYLDRIEHDGAGRPLGLRISGAWTQLVTAAQRFSLSAGTATGASVSASGTATDAWAQWWQVTATGDAAAHLSVSTSNSAANNYVIVAWDVRREGSSRFVQIGSLTGGAQFWANFDLDTGVAASTGTGVTAGVIERPGRVATVYMLARLPAAVTSVDAYVAPVPAANAAKLASSATGASVVARTPIVRHSTTLDGMVVPHAVHTTGTSTRNSDLPTSGASMPSGAADFAVVSMIRTRSEAIQGNSGLAFLFPVNGDTGNQAPFIEFRFASDFSLNIVYNFARQHTFKAVFKPGTVYRYGLTRRGSLLTVVIGDESITLDTGTYGLGTCALWRGRDGTASMLNGFAQRAIWWAEACSAAELRSRVDRYL